MCKILLDAIFPVIPNCRANKIVRQRIHPKNENGEDIEPSGILSFIENADNLSLEIIKEQYNETFKVKEKLEDKAKTNIIGVTISITLIICIVYIIFKDRPCGTHLTLFEVFVQVQICFMNKSIS